MVRSRREQTDPLFVVLVAMMDGYIPTHETTFIEASKVSRFVPRGILTNVLMAQEKLKIGHSAYYGLMCSEWTFRNCWREPIIGDSSEGEDFREVLDVRIRDSCGGSLAGYGITILARQNFERHNRRTLLQGAQTGHSARPQRAKIQRRTLWDTLRI